MSATPSRQSKIRKAERSTTTVFECDHLCVVVWLNAAWHHVQHDGTIAASECAAGVYKLEAELPPHTVNRLERR